MKGDISTHFLVLLVLAIIVLVILVLLNTEIFGKYIRTGVKNLTALLE